MGDEQSAVQSREPVRSELIAYRSQLPMNGRIFFWSLTSALAGFLFGFDTVVISGAEKTIQALWGLTPFVHGFAMASTLYGTVVGSLLGGWPADRFGRKATLLWIGVLYLLGAVGSARSQRLGLHRCPCDWWTRHRHLNRGCADVHF